jgi:type IV secretory pathway VirB3-like protein
MMFLFRTIAGIPAISTGGAAMFFLLLSIDKPVLLLLAMPLFAAFIILLADIDTMGRQLRRQLHKWWKGFGR